MKRSALNTGCGFLMLALLAALEACSGLRVQRPMRPSESDWITLGGAMSRANAATTTLLPPLTPVWEYNAQGGLSTVPLVRDSVVIVTTLHGELQAVNLTNGKRIGYVVLESAIAGTPVLDGGAVIVPLAMKKESLISYNLREGKRTWVFPAGPIESSPLLDDGSLFVTTLEGILICIDKTDGTERWRFETSEKETRKPIHSSPATDGESIFFGSDEGAMYAIDRHTGKLKWKHVMGASVFATPVVVGSSVIAGDLDGVVACLDSKTGATKWIHRTGSKVYAAAASDRATVYVGAADGNLRALDVRTGERRWMFAARSVLGSPPLVAGDLLYVGSLDRTLYALKAATGEEVWRYEAEGRIRVSPVLWGTILLVTYEDKYIAAFKTRPAS